MQMPETIIDLEEGRRLLDAARNALNDWQIIRWDRFNDWMIANGPDLLAEIEALRTRLRATHDKEPPMVDAARAGLDRAKDAP
jgi:hypothetical protein